jgi:hypothetical protein
MEEHPTLPLLVVGERFNMAWWAKHRPDSNFLRLVREGQSQLSDVDGFSYLQAALRFGALHSAGCRTKLRSIGVDLDDVSVAAMNLLPPHEDCSVQGSSQWERALAYRAAERLSEELLSPLRFTYAQPFQRRSRPERVLAVAFCGRRVADAFGISGSRELGSLFDLRFSVKHDEHGTESKYEVWDWDSTPDEESYRLVLGMVLPHPSGLSRWWNDDPLERRREAVKSNVYSLLVRRRRLWGE